MVWSATAAEQALAVDRLRRARSLLFWRYLVERASAAAEAQGVRRQSISAYNLILLGSWPCSQETRQHVAENSS